MMLYVYHLTRYSGPAAGEAHAAVVLAPNSEAARALASTFARLEGWEDWFDTTATRCTVVGTANEEETTGVVLSAFTPR